MEAHAGQKKGKHKQPSRQDAIDSMGSCVWRDCSQLISFLWILDGSEDCHIRDCIPTVEEEVTHFQILKIRPTKLKNCKIARRVRSFGRIIDTSNLTA